MKFEFINAGVFDVFLVLLAAVGLSHVMVDGSIMVPFKNWIKGWTWIEKIFSCYQCSGVWAGLIMGSLYLLSKYYPILIIFHYAFAASFLSMLGATLLLYFNVGDNNEDT